MKQKHAKQKALLLKKFTKSIFPKTKDISIWLPQNGRIKVKAKLIW